MKLKKLAIWVIVSVLLAGGIIAGAIILRSKPETKDNLINMAKIAKPHGDKTHVIVRVSQNIGNEDLDDPFNDIKEDSDDGVSIACWGDSMMEGFGTDEAYILTKNGRVDISYYTAPYTLGRLTGINTYNFGVSGETSAEIARRAGGLKIYTDRDININKTTFTDVCFMDDEDKPVYMYDFSGYGIEYNEYPDTVYINGVLCQIDKRREIDDYEFWEDDDNEEYNIDDFIVGIKICDDTEYNQPEYMYVPEGTIVTPKVAYDHKDDILILEMGSNGGWDDYDDLIAQYQAIIDYTGCENYIIIGDTDDPGTSLADDSQSYMEDNDDYVGTDDTAWEAALREAFGEHFFNTRVYMIQNGLSDCGLKAGKIDELYGAFGYISVKLRSDWTHFNAYGYYSKGVGIYKKGVELGYWD
ncbi:MAG: hypothetical protein Q4E78_06835 [Eubacteriales bacterium]|nr:hypothetical protein [Eubacteriales bacterium]